MTSGSIAKSILDYLEDSITQKRHNFNQSMLKEDETYELKDPLIRRHFVFNSIEEINKKLEKGTKDYTVDFNDDTYYYFDDQTYEYFKQHERILNTILLVFLL